MKNIFINTVIILSFIPFCNLFSKDFKLSGLEEGDIIFHESKSRQSIAIKLATKSKYTHLGIIFKYKNVYQVLEAIEPVKITSLNSFIERGKNNHFVIKRLRDRKKILSKEVVQKMKTYGNSLLGKHYDIYFEWDDKRFYCSELVWKLYNKFAKVRIGELKKLKDFDLSSPMVKSLIEKRFGAKINYEEPVISPNDMFLSKELITVVD
ncbi:MAG: YiiX family permuted papain-like enzyme [Leptospiraceae bacterium]|nr:YiiX family permuted papain-like enzyme [Leptospiraceae bacterium]MCP5498080.1 YiiX family permuted papain-like enzyme [Leptospiraceae bacterium]